MHKVDLQTLYAVNLYR